MNAIMNKKFPDMKLYEEILFLKHWFKGKWVVENVVPYYIPLIKETVKIGRHLFWSNFKINPLEIDCCHIKTATKESLAEFHNMPIFSRTLMRNCVNPKIGQHVFMESLCV